jgi:phosphoenolpyruvate carboxykinase (GTP)
LAQRLPPGLGLGASVEDLDKVVNEPVRNCSAKPDDAGPTNNWVAPTEMKQVMTDLYRSCMRGRTMYVVPFCMGPL